ncbi:MAG: hypothetical protein IJI36_01985 [Kiritimatiellae bacterium]|nr:hypothetical protein [Kiritimatiellia bacterium]
MVGAFAAGAISVHFAASAATHDGNLTLFLGDMHIRGDKSWHSDWIVHVSVERMQLKDLPQMCYH